MLFRSCINAGNTPVQYCATGIVLFFGGINSCKVYKYNEYPLVKWVCCLQTGFLWAAYFFLTIQCRADAEKILLFLSFFCNNIFLNNISLTLPADPFHIQNNATKCALPNDAVQQFYKTDRTCRRDLQGRVHQNIQYEVFDSIMKNFIVKRNQFLFFSVPVIHLFCL